MTPFSTRFLFSFSLITNCNQTQLYRLFSPAHKYFIFEKNHCYRKPVKLCEGFLSLCLSWCSPGEAEDGVCSDSCHTEERVWRRSHQRRSIWDGGGQYGPSCIITDGLPLTTNPLVSLCF